MSDELRHECGVALLRARGAGPAAPGAALLSLLLEKQHNRGQDGAGAAMLALRPVPGRPAYRVFKHAGDHALKDLLADIGRPSDLAEEIWLGHLRYATFGRGDVSCCHPFVHKSSRLDRTLLVAGNFNLTNAKDLFDRHRALGLHPESASDGYLVAELLAHELGAALTSGTAPCPLLAALRRALSLLDGAWTLCGATGDGWTFATRDPHGIRPGWWYEEEGAVAVASERPAIQAAFDCAPERVRELPPGAALLVSPEGRVSLEPCLPPAAPRACVFERIYFSRGNDAAIHAERKALGAALAEPLVSAVGGDFERTVFSYIPNSAQVAFHGLLEALFGRGLAAGRTVRFGQVAVKDAKFRTFIADEGARRMLARHVYDVTYGLVRPGEDTLVVLDDSIVRGNTMRSAILPMLDRLGPRRILVASSAPPILYPDCYGIDMSTLGELVGFRALVRLLDARGGAGAARAALQAALASAAPNPLAALYAEAGPEALAREISSLVAPPGLRARVDVVYQSVAALRRACPGSAGDWYFTGDYPTPGGFRVLRRALENYLAGSQERSY